MIRVYLDWSVVSNYKRQDFSELRDFISAHKEILQFPYSPAHFKDLMKSYRVDNKFFDEDLNNLDYLSETHFLRWGKEGIEVLSASPKQYFQCEKQSGSIFSTMDIEKVFSDLDGDDFGNGEIGTLMKKLFQLQPSGIEITNENKELLQKMFPNLTEQSSMWDLMKDVMPFGKRLMQERDYYKDFRKSISDKGFKLEANSGNWSPEDVIKKIDEFLQQQNTKLTFAEYVATCFKHKKEPVNRFEYYTTAYLMLDMIGYKSDKLPKPTDNMQNIQNDAEHSFYSAHCDYFVAIDKNLRTKTEVLFKEFNIPTIVVTPDELIETLKFKIHVPSTNEHYVNEAFDLLKKENIVETYLKSDHTNVDTCVFRLPIYYFNFFNYAIYHHYPEQNGFILTFKKAFKNYSNFIFYTEADRLFDIICKYFGIENQEEYLEKKKEFVYGDKEVNITWQFEWGVIIFELDTETHRPLLTYVVTIPKKQKGN
jgi:hypothetical protein